MSSRGFVAQSVIFFFTSFARGLAPQNKPELQKVMERRKRDQVFKQKEEEAQKKKSDLEIELLKRQQKLEQVKGNGSVSSVALTTSQCSMNESDCSETA